MKGMKNSEKNMEFQIEGLTLDTGKVVGSTPIAPTIFKLNKSKNYEIPAGSSIVLAIEWSGGLPRIFRTIVPDSSQRCEKGVKSRRSKRVA